MFYIIFVDTGLDIKTVCETIDFHFFYDKTETIKSTN